jgi:uncharacterized heparinase superfamily protein
LSTTHRIIVNCGVPEIGKANWRDVARSTAAHSTVTLNDTSSCRFLQTRSLRHLFGNPIVEGPSYVEVGREVHDQGLSLRTSHDGYLRRFGLVHQRSLALSADGKRLDGEDQFYPGGAKASLGKTRDQFAVRFHLNPEIRAACRDDGITLVLPNKAVWNFSAHDHDVTLEESVYLAAQDGPRRTHQLVISGRARKSLRVVWSFTLVSEPQREGKAAASAELERGLSRSTTGV